MRAFFKVLLLILSISAIMLMTGCNQSDSDDLTYGAVSDYKNSSDDFAYNTTSDNDNSSNTIQNVRGGIVRYEVRREEETGERPEEIVIASRVYSTDLIRFSLPSLNYTSDDIAQLRHFTDLTELRLWDNRISDLSVLSGLTNLTSLHLGRNQISDLTPLTELTNLTDLSLDSNQIGDLSPLSRLTNLERLVLNNNQISDLSPLDGLINLTVLELADNQINDLSPLSGLTNLEELLLSDNQINDMTPLSELMNLNYICMSGNPTGVPPGFISGHNTPRGSVQVGEIIEFGDYNWLVLDIQDDHALIITEHIFMLGVGRYHNLSMAVTWELSSLRHYLNNAFFYSFRPSDRVRIRETLNVNENNPWFGTNAGNDTMDKIFLLSIEEVVRYFGDSGYMQNRPGDATYLSDMYDSVRVGRFKDGRSRFSWLRSPGGGRDLASGVDGAGAIAIFGTGVGNSTATVRPVLWLNLGDGL